jgi:hypothetical protein
MFYLFAFLNQWQLFVIENSDQNAFFVFFEDIQIFMEVAFWRDVYFQVGVDLGEVEVFSE